MATSNTKSPNPESEKTLSTVCLQWHDFSGVFPLICSPFERRQTQSLICLRNLPPLELEPLYMVFTIPFLLGSTSIKSCIASRAVNFFADLSGVGNSHFFKPFLVPMKMIRFRSCGTPKSEALRTLSSTL